MYVKFKVFTSKVKMSVTEVESSKITIYYRLLHKGPSPYHACWPLLGKGWKITNEYNCYKTQYRPELLHYYVNRKTGISRDLQVYNDTSDKPEYNGYVFCCNPDRRHIIRDFEPATVIEFEGPKETTKETYMVLSEHIQALSNLEQISHYCLSFPLFLMEDLVQEDKPNSGHFYVV
jgi:hypothetical protein